MYYQEKKKLKFDEIKKNDQKYLKSTFCKFRLNILI